MLIRKKNRRINFTHAVPVPRCSGVHGHGDKNGSQLPGQVAEALSCREVSEWWRSRHGRADSRVPTALTFMCVSLNRSINAFLLVYLSILVSKAVVCTTLKHIWQNREGPNSAWYNQETQKEKDTYLVSPSCPAIYYYNFFFFFSSLLLLHFSRPLY